MGRKDWRSSTAVKLAGGGFEHVALSLTDRDDGHGLVLEHGPLQRREDGRAELFRLDEPETAVLLDNLVAVEFSYYGARERGEDAEWTDRWDSEQRLPLLVRIRIAFPESDRRIWPELTVALRIQGKGAATASGASAR